MQIKHIFILLFLTGQVLYISAQQPIQYSQYMTNKYLMNPAYGGLEGSLSISAGLRSQWTMLAGSPSAQNISAHLPIYSLQGSVGFSLQNQSSTDFRLTSFSGSYNYIIESNFASISLGARMGIQSVDVSGEGIITPTGIYEGSVPNHQDPILSNQSVGGSGLRWGIGTFIFTDLWELGLTLESFPSSTISVGSTDYTQEEYGLLFLQYNFYYSNTWTFSPSVLVKSDFTQTQIDIFSKVNYSNLFGGIGLRGYNNSSFDALILMVGVQFNKHYRLSYSYDYGISGLRHFHDGTHEFSFNYNLQKLIGNLGEPKVIYNPRY